MKQYILKGLEIEETDISTWTRADEVGTRVAYDVVGDVEISTVFIGLEGQIFETLISRKGARVRQKRYETWDEAEKGHQMLVNAYRAGTI